MVLQSSLIIEWLKYSRDGIGARQIRMASKIDRGDLNIASWSVEALLWVDLERMVAQRPRRLREHKKGTL